MRRVLPMRFASICMIPVGAFCAAAPCSSCWYSMRWATASPATISRPELTVLVTSRYLPNNTANRRLVGVGGWVADKLRRYCAGRIVWSSSSSGRMARRRVSFYFGVVGKSSVPKRSTIYFKLVFKPREFLHIVENIMNFSLCIFLHNILCIYNHIISIHQKCLHKYIAFGLDVYRIYKSIAS